ncbi:MAG TPA: NCS2 family permease [Thermoanaerobaculia bacterium]|nr:NCS2 family permease [Thermoanaerobaculia bacterium]
MTIPALEHLFKLRERRTSAVTEIRAGAVTFLTMSYILFVNPQILSQAGLPARDVLVATALASAAATLVMGIYANFPFALAPGMGLNAYFTYGVVRGMGVSWEVALAAIFVEGILFLLMAFGGLRSAILRAIPKAVKVAIMSGIGLFLTLIGLENAGVVVRSPNTLVALGDLTDPKVLLALAGVLLIAALLAARRKGAILIGILVLTVIAWVAGLATPPSSWIEIPSLPRQTMFAFDFSHLASLKLIPVILAFLFVDIFDTAGSLIGIGRLAGFLDEKGDLPGSERAFTADALGTTVGALLGTSTVTTYVESSTGVEEGGRTGLTAVVVAAFFLLALFFTPIFVAVPPLATAPALIAVGAMMMQGARDLDWSRADEAIPSLLTMAAMPFTYSIANGVSFGIISYVVIKVLLGRFREVKPLMYVLTLLLIFFYAYR